MKKPDLKKLKDKLAAKLPKLKMPDLKMADKWSKLKEKVKPMGAKATALSKSTGAYFKKIGEKIKKNSRDVSIMAGTTGGMFALISAMLYWTNDHDTMPVTIDVADGAKVVVFPEKEKLYYEQNGSYFMADYKRKYMCEGVVSNYGILLFYAENKTSYSMRMCRQFDQAAGDTAFMAENAKKYEKYIEIARKQKPAAPQGLEK